MSENIDLLEESNKAALDPFWAWRGHAIQAYASLEQSLCSLFQHLSGTTKDVASVIFFKITSSRVRDAIIERLLKKKYGNTYSIFWNSMTRLIDVISKKRNEIVHWSAVTVLDDKGFSGMRLCPPNFWDLRAESPFVTTAGLQNFIAECSFLACQCNMFSSFINPLFRAEIARGASPEQMQTWHDIFQQAAIYPPPSTHPLFQKPPEPETQRPPSPGSPQSVIEKSALEKTEKDQGSS